MRTIDEILDDFSLVVAQGSKTPCVDLRGRCKAHEARFRAEARSVAETAINERNEALAECERLRQELREARLLHAADVRRIETQGAKP